uniref:Dead box ATP-dependent RNA helicase n=1 Tax=Rhizophora mucronata TaxID=61149 RepID=A0A2P2PYM0_RHIMU
MSTPLSSSRTCWLIGAPPYATTTLTPV